MLDPERWRPVVGYEGHYEVSTHGRVRSIKRESRILIPDTARRYPAVSLSRDGQKRNRRVHSLVLGAFVGPCPDGLEGLHGDDDPTNNHLSNLRYGSSSENKHDSVRNGRHANATKILCPSGHQYSSDNTIVDKQGKRACRVCRRKHVREAMRRLRARTRKAAAARG